MVHEAIEAYYKNEVDTVLEGAMKSIQERFEELGLSDVLPKVLQASAMEATILEKFSATGMYKKPDGSLYTAPKMTKVWKELAEETGLNFQLKRLRQYQLGDVVLPSGGIPELVARVLYLAQRYQETILIPREAFAEIHIEQEFVFKEPIPMTGMEFEFHGFIDMYGRLKKPKRGQPSWVLIDYKTGKAHDNDTHDMASHSSLQLTIYWRYLTSVLGIAKDDLKIALHYVDAGRESSTIRSLQDVNVIVEMAKNYIAAMDRPGIPKRLFYDGQDCQKCTLRDSCIDEFGYPTAASERFIKEHSNGKSSE